MKQFILKIFFFTLVILIIDKAFLIVRNLAPKYDNDRRLEYVMDGKINKDLLVFGSSRADADVSTWLLEEELGLDSYNLSYGGSEIEFQTFVLKQLLKNNKKPKLIVKIIDDDFELLHNSWNIFRTDRLLPLVKYEEVREELINRREKNNIMSNLFILHQLSKPNFDLRAQKEVNDTIKKYGSITQNKNLPEQNFEWIYETNTKYNKEEEITSKLNAFLEFKTLCINNDIKLILTLPPSFKKANIQFIDRMRGFTDNNHVVLHLYDESIPEYKSNMYFNDRIHLNKKGAKIYTNDLISFIKEEFLLLH